MGEQPRSRECKKGRAESEAETEEKAGTDNSSVTRRSTRVRQASGSCWITAAALIATFSNDPGSYEQALSSQHWKHCRSAVNKELASLKDHKTWILVARPAQHNAVTSKWIFKLKNEWKSDGSFQASYKTRLVARGFSQTGGINYFETFSPVVKLTKIRALLLIVASQNLHLNHMDVGTTFLIRRGGVQQ